MAEIVLLDAGPLGMISHPRAHTEIKDWLAHLLDAQKIVCIPEIADYEVRRELLRSRATKGLIRLDQLKNTLRFLPITSDAMLRAAQFWAVARHQGRPTSHDQSLDADVILAAQAATCSTQTVIIATTNPRHLKRFVNAANWEDVK